LSLQLFQQTLSRIKGSSCYASPFIFSSVILKKNIDNFNRIIPDRIVKEKLVVIKNNQRNRFFSNRNR